MALWLGDSADTYNGLRPHGRRDVSTLTWKGVDGLLVYDYLDSLDLEFGYLHRKSGPGAVMSFTPSSESESDGGSAEGSREESGDEPSSVWVAARSGIQGPV